MASHFFSLFMWNKKEPAKIGFNFRRTQKYQLAHIFISKYSHMNKRFAFHKQ